MILLKISQKVLVPVTKSAKMKKSLLKVFWVVYLFFHGKKIHRGEARRLRRGLKILNPNLILLSNLETKYEEFTIALERPLCWPSKSINYVLDWIVFKNSSDINSNIIPQGWDHDKGLLQEKISDAKAQAQRSYPIKKIILKIDKIFREESGAGAFELIRR